MQATQPHSQPPMASNTSNTGHETTDSTTQTGSPFEELWPMDDLTEDHEPNRANRESMLIPLGDRAEEDWFLAGATSAEHYQNILFESSVYARAADHSPEVRGQQASPREHVVWETTDDETLARLLGEVDQDPPAALSPQPPKPIDERDSSEETPAEPSREKPRQESFDDVALRLANEFVPVVEHDWDTLLYIGPPPQQYKQDDEEYEYIKQHFSKPYLMNSRTLRDTGSAEFVKLLGPASARAQRKLKKLGLHLNLPGGRQPQYYIDLRPPQDGEEAVLLITEMECTPGILTWHVEARKHGVERSVVCGKDDLNFTRRCGNPAARMSGDDFTAKDDHQELAYSALRHHMAIERLLHVISGGDPKLNSAPKVWSFFAIAKYFDCAAHLRVANEIYTWLFANQNSIFIPKNPEVTLRIAIGLKTPDLTRGVYALLVGEKALALADTQSLLTATMPLHLVPSRPLCHLDDDEVNRIDHAAQSLRRRIHHFFGKIANEPMSSWMTESVEVVKLLALKAHRASDQKHLEDTWQILRDYVRGEIYSALSQNLDREEFLSRMYTSTNKKIEARQAYLPIDEYNLYSLPKRLLMQAFWEHLSTYGFHQTKTTVDAWTRGHSLAGLEEVAPDFHDADSGGSIACVPKNSLFEMIDYVNGLISDGAADYFGAYPQMFGTTARELSWNQLVVAARRNVPRVLPATATIEERDLVEAVQLLRLSDKPTASAQSSQRQTRTDIEGDRITNSRINISALLAELGTTLSRVIEAGPLAIGHVQDDIGFVRDIPMLEVGTLLCLGSDEWKYLPLWAGGLDDGSGGVFADSAPDVNAEEGFKGGKRGLSEGLDDLEDIEMGEAGYSVIDGSDFEEIATDEGVSTVGRASRMATDGTRTTIANTIVSLDE